MEMITVTAKTVEDAITQASLQLGVSSDRIQYEVVEKGSAGVLGGLFGSKPQSVIHSMVEYVDGAVIAQLGTPDMKLPIQYALYYPERRFLPGERVDFWSIGHLDFEKPDMDTFYGLALAYEAGRCGGTLPTVFNAANELAVSQFLNREIKYLEITEIIEDCMKAHKTIANPTVEQILDTEQETYDRIRSRR